MNDLPDAGIGDLLDLIKQVCRQLNARPTATPKAQIQAVLYDNDGKRN
jgi:hypothetical protein